MTDQQRAMQAALEFVEMAEEDFPLSSQPVLNALRAALAQQAEPVAWMMTGLDRLGAEHKSLHWHKVWETDNHFTPTPLYAHPPAQPQADTVAVPRELLRALASALHTTACSQDDYENEAAVDALLAGEETK